MIGNITESNRYTENLSILFETARDENQALPMSKYMKSRFEFYGIKAPVRRDILRDYFKSAGLPSDWKKTVEQCWKYDEREMQYAGMEICYRCRKMWKKSDLPFFENMIIQKSWWDTVDFIASGIVGQFLFDFPDQIPAAVEKWSLSGNIWLNRTSLIFQLKYREFTDFRLMQKIIHRLKYSDEFFIQKAIGWALRQYAKTAPKDVKAFVAETELKKLSRKEALKHFS